jgi:copper resistance protein C
MSVAQLIAVVWMTAWHAVLLSSVPARESAVRGPDLAIVLQFSERIDVRRSRVALLRPDHRTELLSVAGGTAPGALESAAHGVSPGSYRIQWQVLSADGHVTRGEVPFTVQ